MISYKKPLFFPLLLVFLILLLPCGCSNTPEKAEEDFLNITEKSTEDVNKDPKQVKLGFYFPGTQPKDWETVRNEIEKQISGTVNASLDFKWLEYKSYMQTVQALSASQEPIDAFCCAKPQEYYPDFIKMARDGQLKDITDLFPQNAPSLYKKYSQQELEYASVNGRLYAIPSLDPHAYATYIMADDAMLKKYGINNIATYEEYEAYLKAVKKEDEKLIPGVISNSIQTLQLFSRGSGYVIADEMQNLVYKWDDAGMTLTAWEKTPEFRTAAGFLISWYKNGYLAANADFTKTTSFLYYGMLSPPQEETTKMTFSDGTGEIKESNPLRMFYLYPDNTVQRDSAMGSFYFNGSFVFNANSSNTERALMFLDWVQQSRSNYLLTCYGIENKHYILQNDYPDLPKGMEYEDRTYYQWDGSWAFSNIDYLYGETALPESDGMTPKEFLDKYSQYAPHGAFYPDYKTLGPVADQRAKAFSAFERRLEQGQITDVSEIDRFITELDELGSDNLVTEAQKQLNEWNAQRVGK